MINLGVFIKIMFFVMAIVLLHYYTQSGVSLSILYKPNKANIPLDKQVLVVDCGIYHICGNANVGFTNCYGDCNSCYHCYYKNNELSIYRKYYIEKTQFTAKHKKMSLILDIEYSLKKLEEVSSLFKSQGGLGALYGV